MPLRFSIIIPNYNSGPTLERAIRSLIGQGHPNLQLIVCDSVSMDDSHQIIERYRAHFDKVIIRKDRGQADGLNHGFEHADGDVFGWLCADDELLPGALAHVAELFDAHPEAQVVTGACERTFADGAVTVVPASPDAWDKINVQNVIEQPATFWRAALHRQVGPLDTGFHLCFDWDFWNRMRSAKAVLRTTHRVLCRYHFSESNKSGSAGRLFVEEASTILCRYGPLRGMLAYVYRFLYLQFDLTGCFDKPPTCTLLRSHLFLHAMAVLRLLIGKRLLYMYNWHFASCQERGLKWW